MKIFRGYYLFLLLFLSPAISRASRPEIPPPGVDKTLLNHKSAFEFFKDRGTANCRAKLEEKRTLFNREKDSLQNSAKGATDKRLGVLENRYVTARKALLAAIEECGECATNPVDTQTVISPLHPEAWYISDGSCQIQNPDPKVREAAFDRMVAHLLHIKRYPNKVGGFNQILDTRAVDPITFAVLEDVDELARPPQNMLLWVRGLETEKKIDAYWYITKNRIDEWGKAPGLREFAFRFTSVPEIPSKSKFERPIIRDKNLFGKPKETKPIPLSDVIGMWYLNSDGYLRYYTAANFGATSYFISEEGRVAGLNAVKQLEEKGTEKI